MTQRRRIKKRVLAPAKKQPRPVPEARKLQRGGRPNWPLSMALLVVELYPNHPPAEVARILTDEHKFPVTRNAVIGKFDRLRKSGWVETIKGKERV